jgi:hypothetical protein
MLSLARVRFPLLTLRSLCRTALLCLVVAGLHPLRLAGQTMDAFTAAHGDLTRVFWIHDEDSTRLHATNGSALRDLLRGRGAQGAFRADVQVHPLVSTTVYNSERAWGQNDGPLWSGRGWNQSFSAGVALRWFVIDAQVRPVWAHAANEPFRLAGDWLSPQQFAVWRRPYSNHDAPQRLDTTAIRGWHPGESWAKVMVGPLSAGVSTQNLWWGPGRRSSIFMSNNAAGFRHATVHTNRPLDLWAFDLQFQYVAARLERSPYNPVNFSDDWRFFTALVVDVEPAFLPGLHVGLVRAFQIRQQDVNSRRDYFPLFQPFQKSKLAPGGGLGDGSQPDDQRASVYVSWSQPRAGFTAYAELGRTDHASDLRDLMLEPNHARAYLLGVHKVFSPEVAGGATWSLSAEFMEAGETTPVAVRLWVAGQSPPSIFFYNHGAVRHGYTNEGQLMGSWYGSGSTGMFVSVQREAGRVELAPARWNDWRVLDAGFIAEMVRHNKVSYKQMWQADPRARQELELIAGAYVGRPFPGGLYVQGGVYGVASRNRYFGPQTDAEGGLRYYNPFNLHAQFTVRYSPFAGNW